MKTPLASTGTSQLLEQLSAFVPDDFINQLLPRRRRPGPRPLFSAAQLYRVLLLALLTPAHSFNLLVSLLGEHRGWRRFARLSHRHRVPDAKTLHQFRDALGVGGLRRINQQVLAPLLAGLAIGQKAVTLIDATDLPAATSAYKKSSPAATRPEGRPWARARSRRGRAGGLPATRSTRCGCGWRATARTCCSCRW